MAPNNVHMTIRRHTFMIVALHTTRHDMIPVEHYVYQFCKESLSLKLLGQVQQFKATFGELRNNPKWTITIL